MNGKEMNRKETAPKQAQLLLDHICKTIPNDLPPLFKQFVCALYANTTPHTLLEKGAENLLEIAQELWTHFQINNPLNQTVAVSKPDQKDPSNTLKHTSLIVILKDKPFLVDSIVSALTQSGYHINASLYPVLDVKRDEKSLLKDVSIGTQHNEGYHREALIHIELNDCLDDGECETLTESITQILQDVEKAVTDWRPMRAKINDSLFDLDQSREAFDEENKREIQAFLQWLDRGYFTFLGYREYLYDTNQTPTLNHTLGILRGFKETLFAATENAENALLEACIGSKKPFSITKTLRPSTVHRPVPMDVIRIRMFDTNGTPTGERLFFGLFTSAAYNRSVEDIPLLRKTATALLKRCGFTPEWHNGKLLLHILESFPRDELFQSSIEFLHETVQSIIHLKERQRLALFVRQDALKHITSCLVYVPRDRFNSLLRKQFSNILSQAFEGSVLSFQTEIGGDLAFARVHFLIATSPLQSINPDLESVEKSLQDASMSWEDRLDEAFVHLHGLGERKKLKHFSSAFSAAYQETFSFQEALEDMEIIGQAFKETTLPINFYKSDDLRENTFSLKLYQEHKPLVISDIMPILENMGLHVITETPYKIIPNNETPPIWLHHFELQLNSEVALKDFNHFKENFEICLTHVWAGSAENDCLNSLVVNANLNWRDASLLRAYFKYLKQTNFPFDMDFVEKTFTAYPEITKNLIGLFYAFFNPAQKNATKETNALIAQLESDLKSISNSNEDRVLRTFRILITSTLRTNYFIQKTEFKPYISFKFDGRSVPDLPLPRPAFEIFVYAPWVEAIHLRGGKVARGGLRWSTRPDFRREVLDLMKAQMVKNTVIIPVGAKGGFIIKTPTDHLSHEERQNQAIFCYQTMIKGMLDITDNLIDGKPVTPPMVNRRDDLDPYLVVAADKGTATFSDIANTISQDYEFWMGDAFASGGSAGYDHKKVGITARGAWVSVARHFRELNLHVQKDPFTVVGVGDMSGDVFGNGMLLSETIKLVGAFNHLHVFLDPNPDLKKSFKERQRLFKLPLSNWSHYNPDALSKGAMIIDRQEKSVTLTPEVQKRFGFEKKTASPNEIIRTLLKWESDLLWFGGIGTFIKSQDESHDEAGDRINDDLRVNAKDLQCKVIGEGANLGMTQRARIEYAANGGRLNTDAIDNSAGVDCSDHEVNIKILLQDPCVQKTLPIEKRNQLLEEMTEEVAHLTLRNNYLQTQAISIIQMRGHKVLGRQTRLMRAVEKIGKLNRDIEYLPDDKNLNERIIDRKGLTRPEISVLLAYGKIFALDQVMASDLPDATFVQENLLDYFPKELQNRFKKAITEHPLKRQIIGNFIANSLVNRMGPTFLNEMMELAHANTVEVMHAYLIVRESFNLRHYWNQIETLDYKVSSNTQYWMFLEILELVERNTFWLLRNRQKAFNLSKDIKQFSNDVKTLMECINTCASTISLEKKNQRIDFLKDKGVPHDLCETFGTFSLMSSAQCIIDISHKTKAPIKVAAQAFFDIHERFNIDWILERLSILGGNNWSKRAVYSMRDQLLDVTTALSESLITHT